MTCEDYQSLGSSRGAAQSEEAAAHAANCSACGAVAAARETLPSDAGLDLTAMFGAITADVDRETGVIAWLRSRTTPTRRAILLGLVALVAAVILLARSRADLAVYPQHRFLIELGLLAVLTASVTALAVRSQLLVTRGRALWLGLGLAVAAPLLLAALPAAHEAMAASMAGVDADFGSRALRCLGFGVLTALPVLVAAWVLRRSTDPDPARDVLMGAVAGLTGVIALTLHCPLTGPAHLAAGHGPVVLAVVAVFVVATLAWARLRPTR